MLPPALESMINPDNIFVWVKIYHYAGANLYYRAKLSTESLILLPSLPICSYFPDHWSNLQMAIFIWFSAYPSWPLKQKVAKFLTSTVLRVNADAFEIVEPMDLKKFCLLLITDGSDSSCTWLWII